MLRDIRKNRIFNRRALIVGLAQGSLASILMMRLGYLQLIKHNEYSIQSDSNRIKPEINPAPRGIIYDRNNVALTKNDSNYRLLLYLGRRIKRDKVVNKLIEVLDLNDKDKEIIINKVKNAKRKTVISLFNSLDWIDLAKVESNSYALPGVRIESGIIRSYPYPKQTSHIVGYVASPSEKEIESSESRLFLHPDFRIGKFGLEKTYDEYLRGVYGVSYVEVNSLDLPIKTLSVDKAKKGNSLNLTIDIRLQEFITNRLKGLSASVVVMDVNNGEVLGYVSAPQFNPNFFVEGVSSKYWQEVSTDKKRPLHNKPISALYPPGSTFKLMVALAALENGFDPNRSINCHGFYKFGRRRFHCWKKEGHGKLNLFQAIEKSCNVYFYHLAKQLGYKKIVEVASKFGYGQDMKLGLAGFKSGILPDQDWKLRNKKGIWVGGDNLNLGIGQGYLLVNPLQMAVASAKIANGGFAVSPRIVKSRNIIQKGYDLGFKKENIDFIKRAMRGVVNNKEGTAYWSRTRIKDFVLAGKTGTSQVVSKRESEMTELENKLNANHAIFSGFAPFDDPKYAISVVVEHGGSGSASAAPIARDVSKYYYNNILKKS